MEGLFHIESGGHESHRKGNEKFENDAEEVVRMVNLYPNLLLTISVPICHIPMGVAMSFSQLFSTFSPCIRVGLSATSLRGAYKLLASTLPLLTDSLTLSI